MSKNFELLYRAGEEDLLPPAPSTESPLVGSPTRIDRSSLTEERDIIPRHDDLLSEDVTRGGPPRSSEPYEINLPLPSKNNSQDNGGPPQFDTVIAADQEAVNPQNQDLLSGRLDRDSRRANEEVINLVQRVFLFPSFEATRVVVFSSVDDSSTSSEICFCAGEVLAAQVSGSVCLVDANVCAPSLHQAFGIGKSPGFLDALGTPDPIKNFALPIARGNLWLIPSGLPPLEAPGLFPSDRLYSRMDELSEQFDFVLINAPPVCSHRHATLLGQRADGIILVVEANSTRRQIARMAISTLQDGKVKLIGAILNNRTFPIPEALYQKL